MRKISAVIPCYNSQNMIGDIVKRLAGCFEARGDDYEIILVNDSSADGTFGVLRTLAAGNRHIKAIDLARNFGQHGALMAGFHYVSGDIVVCLDDDGQTPPESAYKLIDGINDDTDAVYARYQVKKHSAMRNFGSLVNGKMATWLINKPKDLTVSSFFAAKRFVIESVKNYNGAYPYVIGLVLCATNKIKNVDIEHQERLSGRSGYSYGKLISLWLNGFTSFSAKPLRLASYAGTASAFMGFLYGLYIIIKKLINPAVPLGYSSLMAVTLFIGGVLMLILGMIGEYIGRIYVSINNVPQFVVKTSINTDDGGMTE